MLAFSKEAGPSGWTAHSEKDRLDGFRQRGDAADPLATVDAIKSGCEGLRSISQGVYCVAVKVWPSTCIPRL